MHSRAYRPMRYRQTDGNVISKLCVTLANKFRECCNLAEECHSSTDANTS